MLGIGYPPFIFDDHRPNKFNENADSLFRQSWNDRLTIQEDDCMIGHRLDV